MTDYRSKEFYKQMKGEVKERVSEERFEHIKSVAKTAKKIAKVYGCDYKLARLAGILHDWDKDLSDKEIVAKCEKFGIVDQLGQWNVANMPRLLHGPTAACELKKRFPDMPYEVISAISVHTTADVDMDEMDMIIYVADAIEPTRSYPELEELWDLVGKVSLFELYKTVYKYWLERLIEKNRVLHSNTIEIWNNLANKEA